MKYNNEIVGNQYEIRELIMINFIEWYASEEKDREPLRQAIQLYLQQEIWVELECMLLKRVGEITRTMSDNWDTKTEITEYHESEGKSNEMDRRTPKRM